MFVAQYFRCVTPNGASNKATTKSIHEIQNSRSLRQLYAELHLYTTSNNVHFMHSLSIDM